MVTGEAASIWSRRIDLVYLFFFVVHIPVMLGNPSCRLFQSTLVYEAL